MVKSLKIFQADALNSEEVLVVLSDGRSLVLGLAGILNADFKVLPPAERDEDETYYPRVPDATPDVRQ